MRCAPCDLAGRSAIAIILFHRELREFRLAKIQGINTRLPQLHQLAWDGPSPLSHSTVLCSTTCQLETPQVLVTVLHGFLNFDVHAYVESFYFKL
jgi:hypothetical protein